MKTLPTVAGFSPRCVAAVRRLRSLVDQPTFDAMLRRCWPPSRLSPDVAKLERLVAEIAGPRDAEALARIVAYFEGSGAFMATDAPVSLVDASASELSTDEVTRG